MESVALRHVVSVAHHPVLLELDDFNQLVGEVPSPASDCVGYLVLRGQMAILAKGNFRLFAKVGQAGRVVAAHQQVSAGVNTGCNQMD